MVPAFSTSCANLIQKWKSLISCEGSCELDVAPELQNLASDVIARTAFGSSYEEGKKIFQLQKQQAVLVLEAYTSFYFPGLRYSQLTRPYNYFQPLVSFFVFLLSNINQSTPLQTQTLKFLISLYRFIPTKKNKTRYKLDKEIKTILRAIIRNKEQAIQRGDVGAANDLLGLLLQCKDEANHGLRIEDVIEECKLFYFAGQETTANLLTWTMILLSMNPIWQEKARDEVLRVCGKQTPSWKPLITSRL